MLCRGSIHQGDIVEGGKQCPCISLSFLVADAIPKSTEELDDFLEKGTQLYYSICIHGGYSLLTEIPHRISFPDDVFSDETKDPLTGMINMSSDNSEALIFTVESALRNGFMTLTSCF